MMLLESLESTLVRCVRRGQRPCSQALGALLLVLATAAVAIAAPAPPPAELAAWQQQAERVTITRDNWGIPHVHGRTDADAVFGLIYAQAEDDFNRIEMNYLKALGRTAEAEGESRIASDLRMRLLVDADELRSMHASTPAWLQELASAWADGLNYFLATHPQVRPKVITRFEPWMVLSFSEGSIGWDIESVSLPELEAFYGTPRVASLAAAQTEPARAPGGSNGIAIAPQRSASGSPLLLINPHTSFFFRAEAQVQSDTGLNAYGALTWGQFFVYQGFNERLGWMHTSSGADAIDEFVETIVRKPAGLFYRHDGQDRPVESRRVRIAYRSGGGMAEREFTVYRTHHGPIVRAMGEKWIAVQLMHQPVKALTQSYLRTKATNYAEFRQLLDLHSNSSNNTVYADADGNIAYFHANHVPRRDPRRDWTQPVDGSIGGNDWAGIHAVDESPNVRNPPDGWVQNTNNWPYSAAGAASPRAAAFPAYMDQYGENFRGLHAISLLTGSHRFTLDSLLAAAYDSRLPAFDELLPPLFLAYRSLPESDPLRTGLAEQVATLEAWDRRWATGSVATAVAVYWAQELFRTMQADVESESIPLLLRVANESTPGQRLEALASASRQLQQDFGDWRTPWGEINRFQRLTADIVQPFDDQGPSIPVGFTSSTWGTLAAFGARTYPGTRRMYGTNGNSFVAVVEFGKRVRARAVTAGGQSGDPASAHFSDQAERYATGALREVWFYPEELARHTVRRYHPGSQVAADPASTSTD
jgi:acyl-homoserine-lactone acylase